MSIQTEINRLNDAKDTLTNWMDEQDISYEEGANLTSIAETIANINIPNVLNAYSDSQTDVYSCNYVNTHLVDLFYPVGSIYMSVNNTNPEILFGGKWEQIKDKFLLSAGNTYSAGSTGGEATHTLTWNEMPRHQHSTGYVGTDLYSVSQSGSNWVVVTTRGDAVYTGNSGNDQPHNNMPPYLTVYMWKRTE